MNAEHSQHSAPEVRLRFFMPSERLAPFISTYYHMEVRGCGTAVVEDFLHPEWGNLRFSRRTDLRAGIGKEPLRKTPAIIATGPTSLTTRFSVGEGQFWGVGLLPLGWSRFVDAPAHEYADRFCDARAETAFVRVIPLAESLRDDAHSLDQEAQIIDRYLLEQLGEAHADEPDIIRSHAAVVNSQLSTVADMAEATGIKIRTLERLSRRAFGFPPKLLLRRQRFLRSLSQFMLDPSLSWLSTLDYQYHDQAHFVRDFKRFMTMTPNQYRQIPHPILMAAARGRMEIAGEAMQALHGATDE